MELAWRHSRARSHIGGDDSCPLGYPMAEVPGRVSRMSDDRQYAPATLRNRDFILAVLRDVLPATGVILEVACGSGGHIVHLARNFPTLFSNLPILIRMPWWALPRGQRPQASRTCAHP
jgi:hypothetical protein